MIQKRAELPAKKINVNKLMDSLSSPSQFRYIQDGVRIIDVQLSEEREEIEMHLWRLEKSIRCPGIRKTHNLDSLIASHYLVN